jgi:hypothetical protein
MFDPRPLTPPAPAVDPSGAPKADNAPLTREQRRSRRNRPVRSRTISINRMTKRELELGRMLYPEDDYERPKTRSDCADGPRPCPFVSCTHHLYLDVSSRTGAIKLNFPDLEVEDMKESCALDISDRGGATLEEAGAVMNLTRERIRQLEAKALAKLSSSDVSSSLIDFADDSRRVVRRLPILQAVNNLDEDESDDGADVRDESDDEETEK